MRFIPVDKIKKLREAARSGDERAKKILAMQLGGKDDFSGLLDEYFKPVPEQQQPVNGVTEQPAMQKNPKLMQFLKDNNVEEGSDDYESFVEDFYKEFPDEPREIPQVKPEDNVFDMSKLVDDEIEAINGYTKYLNALLSANVCEKVKALINSKITKIIEDEKQHIEIIKLLEKSVNEKHENEENGTIQQ